jgi:predicted DNA-binding ribbon-helix-helix protein
MDRQSTTFRFRKRYLDKLKAIAAREEISQVRVIENLIERFDPTPKSPDLPPPKSVTSDPAV